MAEHKQWAVALLVNTEHTYNVLARTAEEAESLAEDLFDSGDEGDVASTSIDSVLAVSGDDIATPEEIDDSIFEEDSCPDIS